jgi:hypothetical protein
LPLIKNRFNPVVSNGVTGCNEKEEEK